MKIDDFIATLAVKDTGCRATTHPLLKAQPHPAAARELLGKSRADLYPKGLRHCATRPEAKSLFAVVSRVPARTPLGRKCNAPLSSAVHQKTFSSHVRDQGEGGVWGSSTRYRTYGVFPAVCLSASKFWSVCF
jgi:hypothetical protein